MSYLTSSLALSVLLLLISSVQNAASIDYKTALTKSLLYYEAQRSGKLPSSQRVQWRGHSALNDGKDIGVDLVGGYYDAGDNVKFGFPMAFTVTMLAWSVIEFRPKLQATGELTNALTALRWGADYLVKAHPEPNVLYAQVGDGNSDHSCWERPEDMTTPRTAYKIDERNPGSDLAGETAAALAAASIAFNDGRDSRYSSKLLDHAEQLFNFATRNSGLYQNSVPGVGQFYSSSGYMDELLWAASWLARASDDRKYADYINQSSDSGGTRTMFSWDDKYVGAQVLITKGLLEGKFEGNPNLYQFKYDAEQYICNCIQNGTRNMPKTSGGLLWFSEWNNLQYVTTASFIVSVYADILSVTKSTMQCKETVVRPDDLIDFARSQVDYILGSNPKEMSYMVGFGSSYPKRVHHRGASIISIKKDSTPVTCQGGFDKWFHGSGDNPNVLEGAIVGGPNQNDAYDDARENYHQAESATVNTAPFVGVLARLA